MVKKKKSCQHCGSAHQCERCNCCGYCRECGRWMALPYVPVYPYWHWHVPWPYQYPVWTPTVVPAQPYFQGSQQLPVNPNSGNQTIVHNIPSQTYQGNVPTTVGNALTITTTPSSTYQS